MQSWKFSILFKQSASLLILKKEKIITPIRHQTWFIFLFFFYIPVSGCLLSPMLFSAFLLEASPSVFSGIRITCSLCFSFSFFCHESVVSIMFFWISFDFFSIVSEPHLSCFLLFHIHFAPLKFIFVHPINLWKCFFRYLSEFLLSQLQPLFLLLLLFSMGFLSNSNLSHPFFQGSFTITIFSNIYCEESSVLANMYILVAGPHLIDSGLPFTLLYWWHLCFFFQYFCLASFFNLVLCKWYCYS